MLRRHLKRLRGRHRTPVVPALTKGETMKRLIRACLVFLVVTSPFCLGCVDSSDYGGPVDITEMQCIFYDESGDGTIKECALPGVFITGAETTANLLDVEFTFVNYSLNRVRLNRMNVEYTAPWGPAIPNHSQRMAVDIPPRPRTIRTPVPTTSRCPSPSGRWSRRATYSSARVSTRPPPSWSTARSPSSTTPAVARSRVWSGKSPSNCYSAGGQTGQPGARLMRSPMGPR